MPVFKYYIYKNPNCHKSGIGIKNIINEVDGQRLANNHELLRKQDEK